jgi:hypothetical protein
VLWQQRSIFGLKIERRQVAGLENVVLDVELPGPFRDPISIIALGEKAAQTEQAKYLAGIIESTLLGLWAHGLIVVRRAVTYHAYIGLRSSRGHEYLLFPGAVRQLAPLDGFLERRILRAVYSEDEQGVSIKALMKAIHPEEGHKPARWFIQRIRRNAVQRGVGEFTGKLPFGRFRLLPASAGCLQEQARLLQVLHEQVSRDHPDLIKVIQTQIRTSIPR